MIRTRHPKQLIPFWLSYGSLGVCLMILGAFLVLVLQGPNSTKVSTSTLAQNNHRLIQLDTQSARFILNNGIAVLERNSSEDDPYRLLHFNWSEIYWRLAANIRYATPYEILKTQLPVLALFKPQLPKPPAPVQLVQTQKIINPQPVIQRETVIPSTASEPLVLLFHTHTTESYLPESGKERSNPDKEELGDIVKVGHHLQQVLEQTYGISSIHCTKIHDSYPFRESYLRSQETVKEYLTKYPSIKVVLDIHRDATPGIDATCVLAGESVAKILLVVGTDRMGLNHPNWKNNHEFAKELSQSMNQYYAGLNSGILVSNARYNQHLHPQALIIEIGDHHTELKEAQRAVEAFASILAMKLKTQPEAQALPVPAGAGTVGPDVGGDLTNGSLNKSTP